MIFAVLASFGCTRNHEGIEWGPQKVVDVAKVSTYVQVGRLVLELPVLNWDEQVVSLVLRLFQPGQS